MVHSHRKTEKVFFRQPETFDMCTTGDTAHIDIRYSSSCHTRVNMVASIFFTAAMIRAFRSARSRGNCTLHKCTLHSNHRLTRVIFQHTKRLVPRSGHFITTLPSGRNVNYYEKQLAGEKFFELFLLSVQVS